MTAAAAHSPVERTLENPVAALHGGIGFVGPDVPIEVLLASGRAFGHLPWSADEQTPFADRWLESSFPFWARSILEQWNARVFDALEAVVFSRADDASQRLYYYVRELQRRDLLPGPEPLMFDIAHVQRESSIEHTAAAISRLCSALAVEPGGLTAAITRANGLRETLARLEADRLSHGSLHERLARAALWSDPTQWIDEFVVPEPDAFRQRVLLAGSVPPDDRIHHAVEAAGASVIAEAHVFGLGRLGPEVCVGALSPEAALARQLRIASVSPRAVIDRAEWIVDRARAARAAAVIIWLTREDEALAWHVPAQRSALAAAGLATLVLPAAHWRADDRALDLVAEFVTEGSHAAT
jgi:hypothetical protein